MPVRVADEISYRGFCVIFAYKFRKSDTFWPLIGDKLFYIGDIPEQDGSGSSSFRV
jgi:hypothetical protein